MGKFKVWIHIEEVDDKGDMIQEHGLPEEAGCFDKLEDAQTFVDDLFGI